MYKPRVLVLFLTAVIFSVNTGSTLANNRDRTVTVVTYNMYLGTDFTEIFSVETPAELVAEVAEAYGDVQSGDPEARISAIADQIEAAGPTLVGLQEVALWRTGTFNDPDPAEDVAYDFLQMLLDELAERGLRYRAVSINTGFDAELPAAGANVFADVRYTDRDVILVRTDLRTSQLKIIGTQSGTFDNLLTLPLLIGNVTVPRGWNSVDVKLRGKTYRFINAHTEAFHPYFQYAQTGELLAGPADTELPVIMVGDFNSDAETAGASYLLMLGAGFADAWEVVRPTDPGYTWPLFLESPLIFTNPTERLDLVLFRGGISASDVDLLGEDPVADITSSGMRPSDHAGVSATLILQP